METDITTRLDRIEETLAAFQDMLAALLNRETQKDWYSVAEFGRLAGRSSFTVREHCRHGRIQAVKKESGRGKHTGWAIPHAELLRFEKEGLRRIQTPKAEDGDDRLSGDAG